MKGVISILSCLLYLALSVGVSIDIHLCSGQLSSSNKEECKERGCCSDSESQTCCTSETYLVQLEDLVQIAKGQHEFQITKPFGASQLFLATDLINTQESIFHRSGHKLGYDSTPLYTLFGSPLHYG